MINLLRLIQLLIFALGLIAFGGNNAAKAQHDRHNGDTAAPLRTSGVRHNGAHPEKGTHLGDEHVDEGKNIDSRTPVIGANVTLGRLEEIALANNPTLKQAGFAVAAAAGRRKQAGLFPNPVVGYSGEGLSMRGLSDGGEHTLFVEQRIPLGGKLAKSRRIFAEEVKRTEAEAEAQRLRVLNTVRLLYHEALGAQRLVDIKRDLAKLADEAVETSIELINVGVEDESHRLRTEIERQRADAAYFDALTAYEEVWQRIGAAIGVPEIEPALLEEDRSSVEEIDARSMLETLLADSPEIKAAEANVDRANAALRRARAEKSPDLFVRAGFGYNNERLDHALNGGRVGPEVSIELGVSIPIFDRSKGRVQTAEAELAIAQGEVHRVKLVLRTRFARELRNYRTAAHKAARYRAQILPRAKAAFEMHSAGFGAMTTSYTEVLGSRQAYLRAQEEYSQLVTAMQRSVVLLRGFLLDGGLNSPGEATDSPRVQNEARPAGTGSVDDPE